MENVHLTDLTDRYSLESISSRIDFMLVRPRDLPPICGINVQTEMIFHYSSSCLLGVGVVKIGCQFARSSETSGAQCVVSQA